MFNSGVKKSAALLGAFALAVSLAACAQSSEASTAPESGPSEQLPAGIKDRGTLLFGSAMNQTPWSFYDDDHKPTGIDIDICNAIADRLGVVAEWSDLDWQGLIPGLQAGRFDASCAGIYITPEREDIVTLVPYLSSGLSVLTQEDSTASIGGLEDLCGLSVSTLQGSSQETTINAQSDECVANGEEAVTVASFDSQPMAVQELHNGRVDAFVASDQLSGYYATQYDGLKVVADGINPVEVGIALPLESTELAALFEEELAGMAADGTYLEILEKWGVDNSAYEGLSAE